MDKVDNYSSLVLSLFEEIKHPNESLKDAVTWRLEGVKSVCAALATSLEEANIERRSDIACDSVAKTFGVIEKELQLINVLVDQGLQDKKMQCDATIFKKKNEVKAV